MIPASVLPAWLSGTDPEQIVVSSRIRLARNLASHFFPDRSIPAERMRVFSEISSAAASLPAFAEMTCCNMVDLSAQRRQLLLERRAASRKLVEGSGDRGTISTDNAALSLLVNEEDHIRIQAIGPGLCALDLWEHADNADTELGDKLEYAFEPSRGFLTSCPTNAGTGLRASFLMHLPALALTGALDQVLAGAGQLGFAVRGFFGEGSDAVGHYFQISNRAGCGMSEDDFIHETALLASRMTDYERSARTKLFNDAGEELAEKVWRSIGILLYARSLTLREFLSLSSCLRLGVAAGIVPDLTVEFLNRLMLSSFPAHLELAAGESFSSENADRVRAAMISKALSEII